ncbi:MAG: hypothetical protein JJ975_06865 [Bacteroidia bacterium]|nr:hypothetical protein [Bacteroidia bacterium]
MIIRQIRVVILLIFVGFYACKSRKSPEPPAQNNPAVECSDTISYASVIKPIFDQKCIRCHSGKLPKGGIDLASYERASRVPGHRMECVVSAGGACNSMPPNGEPLTPDEAQYIQCWVSTGMNN